MSSTPCLPPSCCPPKPRLSDRPLITVTQAKNLAAVFKLLANDTRARLLHALVRAGELGVTELAQGVNMTPQAVSNQLQRLADRRVVATRRVGTGIRYRIVDPCVADLFDRALCLLEDAQSGIHEDPS